MRIDLHTKRKKLGLLLLDLYLLVNDTILIDGLDKESVTFNKFIIALRKVAYLIRSLGKSSAVLLRGFKSITQ